MKGSNADIQGLIDTGQLSKFASLWSIYEQISQTVAQDAGLTGCMRQATESLNELVAARTQLEVAKKKLNETNATHKAQSRRCVTSRRRPEVCCRWWDRGPAIQE